MYAKINECPKKFEHFIPNILIYIIYGEVQTICLPEINARLLQFYIFCKCRKRFWEMKGCLLIIW